MCTKIDKYFPPPYLALALLPEVKFYGYDYQSLSTSSSISAIFNPCSVSKGAILWLWVSQNKQYGTTERAGLQYIHGHCPLDNYIHKTMKQYWGIRARCPVCTQYWAPMLLVVKLVKSAHTAHSALTKVIITNLSDLAFPNLSSLLQVLNSVSNTQYIYSNT